MNSRYEFSRCLLPAVWVCLCAASLAAAQTGVQPAGWDAGVRLLEAVDTNPNPRVVEIDLVARIARVEIAAGQSVEACTATSSITPRAG